jgi:hypothetical protein
MAVTAQFYASAPLSLGLESPVTIDRRLCSCKDTLDDVIGEKKGVLSMSGAEYRFLGLSPLILVTTPTESCQLPTLDL